MKLFTVNNVEFQIDECDLPLLEGHRWYGFARTRGRTKYICTHGPSTLYLHRLILSAPAGLYVDHIDRDGTNNRRSNLRLATPSQSSMNMNQKRGISGYRGVFRSRAIGIKWVARVQVNSKRYQVGPFLDPLEAALAYDRLARIHHGEFAILNFPDRIAA